MKRLLRAKKNMKSNKVVAKRVKNAKELGKGEAQEPEERVSKRTR